MKKKLLICVLVLVMACMSGCGGSTDTAADISEVDISELQGPELSFTADTWPRIDGATALAPYYEAMTAEILGMDPEEARQYVYCNKTDGAYLNLIEGCADMIFCSLPSSQQQEMAETAGVEFELTPFLNGGFVFFVNKDNPVDGLTVEQFHDIYTGKITNWSKLGGPDMDIIAYQRPDNSGSQTGLYEYIVPEDEVMYAPTEKKIETMGGIVDAVSSYENAKGAIGYSYYYYVTSMHYSDDIKLLAVNGVLPSDETIANGTYPLINPSYVIINANTPADSPLRDIIEWIRSEKGQYVAKQAGYVPIKASK